ncbi:MAG: carboxylesterase/lipase family protein [Aeromicrobium sp.]
MSDAGTGAREADAAGAEQLNASIEGGTVRGTAEGDLITFRGIPFAQPPIGALRWRAPQPVKPWDGVLEASAFGHDSMQLPTPGAPDTAGTSEDCLYLNVWRPAERATKPLPVMVWIYGGGMVRGRGSRYVLDRFTSQGGMVVVSFNYRENRLGFFAHPALAEEAPDDPRGNYAFMDQIAALQWVQLNIAAFGGDPNTVTIAGESAGAGSVLAMMISPMARGLFHQAILESPGLPSARAAVLSLRDLDSAESRALQFASEENIVGNGAAALAALRALPAEEVVAAEGLEFATAVTEYAGGPEIPGFTASMIDGRLICETVEGALRSGRQAMVPVICGANNLDLAPSVAQSKDAVFAQFGALATRARELYDPSGDVDLKALSQAVYADRTMVEPTRHLAEMMAGAGQRAYYYRFSYVGEPYRQQLPGAFHGFEIPYAYDMPVAFDGKAFVLAEKGDADQAMARTMAGYWADFVRTGDPNGTGRAEWPPFDPTARHVLDFGNSGVTVGADPLKDRLDLWRSVWEPRG